MYKFKELSQESQEKAINFYIMFLIETTAFEDLHHNSNLYKAYKSCKEMKTPWFIGEYIWDYCKKGILRDLSRNFFNENGELIPVDINCS